MTGARYHCRDERRRSALAASGQPDMSGIDYLEVHRGGTTADPTRIDIVLVKPLPLPLAALTGDRIALTGGVRFPAPRVDPIVAATPGGSEVSRYTVTVPGGQPTDFSTYRLAIVDWPGTTTPPAFIDPRLSAVDFSFAVDCPADGDCEPGCTDPPEPAPPDPHFDYRTRDWAGFRRLMLDRLAVLVPGFREDDPVDLTTTIVEALAFRADQQSYTLDWVGTEAFLDTARTRTSVTRHARLLDYTPGEGASARTFVRFALDPGSALGEGHLLPGGTPVLPRSDALPTVVAAADYPGLLASSPVVFETLADLELWRRRDDIALHTWSDDSCTLPAGATAATLVDAVDGPGRLEPGHLLLLAEIAAPDTGRLEDADPAHRHVVRLTRVSTATDVLADDTPLIDVEWDAADALPFDLPVTARVPQPSGPARHVVCAVAQGNVVLAEHGATLPPPAHLHLPPSATGALTPQLSPAAPQAGTVWRPRVTGGIGPLARVAQHGPADAGPTPAAALVTVDPARCLPQITLLDAFAPWTVRRDLLASGRFSRDFVVETGPDGRAVLRFGDGRYGLAPAVGDALAVSGRFGTGPDGSLGPDALGHVVLRDTDRSLPISRVTNPVAASGGTAPEEDAAVRVAAPRAFRRQERAVIPEDYAEAARRYPGVSDAVAVPRWTGAWQTVLVHVDRQGGAGVDAAFRAGLLAHLEAYRLAGYDVAVRAARTVPLDVDLSVCAEPGRVRSEVGRQVRAVLSPAGIGGAPGFFHPDRFTFGTPLYLSSLLAAVLAVPGVQSVTPLVFQRFGRPAQGELGRGVIRPVAAEVLELRDDPSFPERGRLRITTGGGR
ncbi:baseplate J/gp47 family protein [Kitasatospora sp. MBT63]|uniref:baseplate J/gp47 family protein n=1 Tax=Kitasatospora sp. MBT63 TaxID=1444768 RepID=UPI00053A1331|nr:baseplate J/gp47 family protein [Kitasatospora sp. MBT63]